MHGLAKDAEVLFHAGVKPDGVAFVGLLTGCSRKGMVEKDQEYLRRMVGEYEIKPTLEHLSCIVDMLAGAGRVDEAEEFIRNMDMKPDAVVWGGLLNARKVYKNGDMAERANNGTARENTPQDGIS